MPDLNLHGHVLVTTGFDRNLRNSALDLKYVHVSSGRKCIQLLFLLTTREGVCTSYGLSLVVCTILPGVGTTTLSVATNTGPSSLNVIMSNSMARCHRSKFFFCFCLNCSPILQKFCKSDHLGINDLVKIGSVEQICLSISSLTGECWHHDKGVDL